MVRSRGIDASKDIAQVAMRIEQSDAAAGTDVGNDQVVQQSRLSHTGLADDGQMPAAILGQDAETSAAAAKFRLTQNGHVRMLLLRR